MRHTHIPSASSTICLSLWLKGGRVKCKTEEKKKQKLAEAIILAKNEITKTFLNEVKKAKVIQGTRVISVSLQNIIDYVKKY